MLSDRDPYEAARAKVEWAKCLNGLDDDKWAAVLLEGGTVFKRLEAKRDLENVEKLLD